MWLSAGDKGRKEYRGLGCLGEVSWPRLLVLVLKGAFNLKRHRKGLIQLVVSEEALCGGGYKLRFQGQAGIHIPAATHTCLLTLGKFHSLFKPLFPHLESGHSSSPNFLGLMWKLSEIIHVESLSQFSQWMVFFVIITMFILISASLLSYSCPPTYLSSPKTLCHPPPFPRWGNRGS